MWLEFYNACSNMPPSEHSLSGRNRSTSPLFACSHAAKGLAHREPGQSQPVAGVVVVADSPFTVQKTFACNVFVVTNVDCESSIQIGN